MYDKIKKNILDNSKRTVIMGILNITPDSFFDGGKFFHNNQKAIDYAEEMIKNGAEIIDIGGESTRPDAEPVSIEEELGRVLPVIEGVKSRFGNNILISVDTYKSEVAREAVKRGANIINDVSGLQLDSNMASVVSATNAYVIINHMRGNPKSMQKGEITYKDVIKDITFFFQEKINQLEQHGFSKQKIILDPGFGFGKTKQHNIEIINGIGDFKVFNLPILIGISRKSTLVKILQETSHTNEIPSGNDRMEASLAASALAVLHGASIVRTHDVRETNRFFNVFDYIRNSKSI